MNTGYVTHATDRVLWCYREPGLNEGERKIALTWLNTVENEMRAIEKETPSAKAPNFALTLREDKTIGWDTDKRYDELMRLAKVLGDLNSTAKL